MITNVSFSDKSIKIKNTQSFGMARLNQLGRETSDKFEFQRNTFLNGKMYEKQGLFEASLLSKKIENNEDFAKLCKIYGCTKNAKDNADFIKNQVLVQKSFASIKKVEEENLAEGLLALYYSNFDNPELSVKQTRQLLEMASDYMSPEEYIKNVGLLEAGTSP